MDPAAVWGRGEEGGRRHRGNTRRFRACNGNRDTHDVGGVGDEGSGSEVSGDSNVLDGRGESEERSYISVREGVVARSGGVGTESGLEERNVLGFVLSDFAKEIEEGMGRDQRS